MICPRCDAQGLICKAKLSDIGIELYVCDECEACWLKDDVISISNFKDLSEFLQEHGLIYDDAQIEYQEYIDCSSEERKKSFFNVSGSELILLIDEAWVRKNKPLPYDRGAYIIDMKKIIGIKGESGIKIIVAPGTAEIKTAYPVKIQHM